MMQRSKGYVQFLMKLFRVSCLTIGIEQNKNGCNDCGNVTRGLHKYDSSEHIYCALGFPKLGKTQVPQGCFNEAFQTLY